MKKYITLAIMLTLLDGEVHKAKELSEKFEASLKTIYRSIDTLLEAGMPLSVNLGRNGGFSLIDSNKVDSGFFTNNELCSFLSYVSANPDKFDNISNNTLLERIKKSLNKQSANKIIEKSQQIIIDTDIWGSVGVYSQNQNILSHAIENMLKVKIDYIDKNGSKRTIHPYALVFKAGSWYVYSFCELKKDFRLFKLSRMKRIEITTETFERKDIDCLSKPWNFSFHQNLENINMVFEIENQLVPELYDWFGNKFQIVEFGEKTSKISATVVRSIGLIHRIMQYGNKITILSPESLIFDIKSECENIFKKYQVS